MSSEENEIKMRQYAILTKLSDIELQLGALVKGLTALEEKVMKGSW
jgi:hypothetical protein